VTNGWHIIIGDGDTSRTFKVGIADREKAKAAAIRQCADPTGLAALPLKEGEFEELPLSEGQVLEIRNA
jgi:hypothetical protein